MSETKEEISIKGTIFFIKFFLSHLKRHKFFLLLAIVLGITVGVLRAVMSKPLYTAEVSFIMDNGQGGGKASMLLGLASQFGLGGSGGSGMTEDKLLFISQSREVMIKTLLHKNVLDGKSDFNINHFIRKRLKESDKKESKVVFIENSESGKRSLKEDSVLNACANLFSHKLLQYSKTKEGVFKINLKLENEHLAVFLINDLFTSIIEFFNYQTSQKKQKSYLLVKTTSDSLYEELMKREYHLASIMDGTQRMIKMKGRVPELEMQREVKVLNVLYAESLKNLEVVRFDMLYNTPVIQGIDKPILPLLKEKKSLVLAVLGGIFIGALLGSLWVFAKLFYQKYWRA